MAAHQSSMEMYQKRVKDAGFLREIKRHLGQNLASTVEEDPETKEQEGNDAATILALKNQAGQDGTEG